MASLTEARAERRSFIRVDSNKPVGGASATMAPGVSFRDLLAYNHFSCERAEQLTIGIEAELTALSVERVVEILIATLGGSYTGSREHGTEVAHFIEGTRIGAIRIDPVSLRRILNRWQERRSGGRAVDALVGAIARKVDAWAGQLEIVTEPIKLRMVAEFGRALDALGLAGAKGASNFGRPVSMQVNIGIDASDPALIKNILANYYRNAKQIRREIRPILLRRGFIRPVRSAFLAKLEDDDWTPTLEELFDWYQRNSPGKLSSIQLFCALLTHDANFNRCPQPKAGKARERRPVAEFREANAVFSTHADPTLASRCLLIEVLFALSLVIASRMAGNLSVASERARAFASSRQDDTVPLRCAGTTQCTGTGPRECLDQIHERVEAAKAEYARSGQFICGEGVAVSPYREVRQWQCRLAESSSTPCTLQRDDCLPLAERSQHS